MAATQPYSKRKPRTPGQPLSAILRGASAHKPNPMDQTRELAKKKRPDPLAAAKQGDARGGMSLAQELSAKPGKPVNQSSGSGSTRKPRGDGQKLVPDGPLKTVIGRRTNLTSNERAGKKFTEFTKSDMPGYVFHDYGRDPKTGKRILVRVKKKASINPPA